MKAQKPKKLTLKKETLRTLTPKELGQVGGGYRHTHYCSRYCSRYCSCMWCK